jgi:hypothetical protein
VSNLLPLKFALCALGGLELENDLAFDVVCLLVLLTLFASFYFEYAIYQLQYFCASSVNTVEHHWLLNIELPAWHSSGCSRA